MSKSCLFIVDPLPTLNPSKDSSLAMMNAAAAQGYTVWITTIADLFSDGQVHAHAHAWPDVAHEKISALSEYTVVMMRKDPPVDATYIYATHLLSSAKKEGAWIVNDPDFLRNHHEKLSILDFPSLIPPTCVTQKKTHIHTFIAQHRTVILKPLHSMGGEGIIRLQEGDPNTDSIIELLTQNETRLIMVQRYLPEIEEGDKRVFIIAGEVYPYAVLRVPQPKQIRANLAQGGTAQVTRLSTREQTAAQHVADTLYQPGILLLGLDMIGGYLTEINSTSPTCLVPIEQSGYAKPTRYIIAQAERHVCAS